MIGRRERVHDDFREDPIFCIAVCQISHGGKHLWPTFAGIPFDFMVLNGRTQ
jgi:hypothetical protein